MNRSFINLIYLFLRFFPDLWSLFSPIQKMIVDRGNRVNGCLGLELWLGRLREGAIKFKLGLNKQNNLRQIYQYLIQDSQNYQNSHKEQFMLNIQSPFIKDIPECKLIMRRLRKKISKYSSTHKEAKKPRDQSHDILNILKSRNLPGFIMETIRKRRTFDLMCLKNVVMNGESDLQEMARLAANQEQEIQTIFVEHKTRIRKPVPKMMPKLERRSTNCSSTQEDEQSSSNYDEDLSDNFQGRSLEKDIHTGGRGEMGSEDLEEDGSGFHGRDFLSFQGDMYSQEEWLKF